MLGRNSHIPLYKQLQDLITDRINWGELGAGDKLPSVKTLASDQRISHITVTRAIRNLVDQGLLETIQGKGIFVRSSKKIDQPLHTLTSFTDDMAERNLIPSSTLIKSSIIPSPPSVASALGINPGSSVAYIEQLRKANDEPMLLEKTFMNEMLCPGILTHNLEESSLYQILTNHYHLTFTRSKLTFEAVLLRSDEAELFGIEAREPAFLSTVIAYLDDDRPIEYTKQIFRGDRYRLIGEARGYKKMKDAWPESLVQQENPVRRRNHDI